MKWMILMAIRQSGDTAQPKGKIHHHGGGGGNEDAYKVNSSVCDCALGVPARQHPPANFRESSTDNGLILSPPLLTRLSCYVPLHTMVRICHAI